MGIRKYGLCFFFFFFIIFYCFLHLSAASRSLSFSSAHHVQENRIGRKIVNKESSMREASNNVVQVNRRGGGRGSIGGRTYGGSSHPGGTTVIPVYGAGAGAVHRSRKSTGNNIHGRVAVVTALLVAILVSLVIYL